MQNRGSYSLSFSTRSTVSKPIYIETGLKHQCLVILSDTRRVLFVCKSNSNVYLWSKCWNMLEFEFSLPVPMTTFQTDVRGVASQIVLLDLFTVSQCFDAATFWIDYSSYDTIVSIFKHLYFWGVQDYHDQTTCLTRSGQAFAVC